MGIAREIRAHRALQVLPRAGVEESIAGQKASAENCALSLRQGQLPVARRDAIHPLAGSSTDAVMTIATPARDSLRRIARLPLTTRLLGKAMAPWYRLLGKDRYDDFRLEWVHE